MVSGPAHPATTKHPAIPPARKHWRLKSVWHECLHQGLEQIRSESCFLFFFFPFSQGTVCQHPPFPSVGSHHTPCWFPPSFPAQSSAMVSLLLVHLQITECKSQILYFPPSMHPLNWSHLCPQPQPRSTDVLKGHSPGPQQPAAAAHTVPGPEDWLCAGV